MDTFDITKTTRITDSGVVKTSNGYHHMRVVALHGDRRRLRTRIYHDQHYAFQSSYHVELWHENKWVEVCRWVGGDANINLPPLYQDTRHKVETAVGEHVTWMLGIAVEVLS
jgi:hypothetical protein